MALNVLVSPGCAEVSADYLDRALGKDDVIIDVGSIFTALTGSTAIPSSRPAALRLAIGLRTVAIRNARENGVSGVIRTGDGSRSAIRKLQEEAGGATVQVLHIDRDEACRRVRSIVSTEDRRAACTAGLDRFYKRYIPAPEDEVVR